MEKEDIRLKQKNLLLFLRKKQGLTQKQLADRLEKPYSWVQKLEYGETLLSNITLKNALDLAAILDVEVQEFILDDC